ncbi:MAG: MlaD family protein [Halopseudomonas sabulinigri]|tara:strand:- start:165 stop:1103 length:939 start_codon:yes stop_codon:yes gene_type:complete
METRAHHVLIGLFTVLSALAAISFAIWMSSSSASSEYRYYTVLFKQAVTGLSRGSAVQFSGIRIGDITELTLDKQDPRKVRARIRIDPSVPITESTVAGLSFTGITGNSVLELSHKNPNSPPLQGKDGEDPIIYAKPSPLSSLLENGEDLMTNINQLIVSARDILSEENVDHLSKTLEGLHQATDSISNPNGNLQQLLVELTETSRAAKSALEQSNQLIANADRLVSNQGAQTLDSARDAMASVAQSSATLENILTDNQAAFSSGMQGLGQLDPAINELRSTLAELRLLTRRLQDDPARFLLGRENKQEFQP